MGVSWTPGIGDPSPIGWATVVAYMLGAALCFRASSTRGRRTKSATEAAAARRDVRLLRFAAACLFLLGINKQLDLQSLFTEVARAYAKSAGWYASRRAYQRLFIIGLAILGLSTGTVLLWQLRASSRSIKLILVGLTFLATFVIIRAASFHHADIWLGSTTIGGLRWNWVLELTGIAVVAIGAQSYRLNRKS